MQGNKPTVSVVMNCLNGEEYLREAIDSVYSQTYADWEIVFWDNASEDQSAEIAKSYDYRLKYFKGEKTVSLGAARNKALNQCNGEYIAFLDCDDLWLSQKLEIQVDLLQKNPDILLCYSDGCFLYGSNKSKKKFSSSNNVRFYEGEIFDYLIISNFINWQTVLINRKQAGANLYFNEELTYSEDHEILLRLSLIGKIKYIPQTLIYYRFHETNMSHDYELILKESEKIYQLFENEIIERKINLNKARALIYGSIIIQLIKQKGDYKKISRYLIKYSNFQNVIVYLLIKFNLTGLLRFIERF